MIETTCTCCEAKSYHSDLRSAMLASCGPLLTPGHREVIDILCAHGPLTLTQIAALDRHHVGAFDRPMTAIYLRRLVKRVNDAMLIGAPDGMAITTTSRIAPSAGPGDPLLFVYALPGTAWEGLAGAEPHLRARDALVGLSEGAAT